MTSRTGVSRGLRLTTLLICIAAWIGAFVATHSPIPAPLATEHVSDKTIHVVGYFGLSSIFWLTLLAYGKGGKVRTLATGIVMAAYGAFDEVTQPLFNRFASFDDWLADVCGIIIAVGALQCALQLRRTVARRRTRKN